MLFDQRRHNGRTRKVDDRFADHVVSALYQTTPDRGWEGPTWTRALLCLEMARVGLPRVAVYAMGRVLRSIGARLGMPMPMVLCPWKRRKRLRLLREIAALADAATPK